MNALTARQVFRTLRDQRGRPRFFVALPALASLGNTRFSISIINIAADGAMIETRTFVPDHARLMISCGTVDVEATVVWRGTSREFGLRFERSLARWEVDEQIARSVALNSRRKQRCLGGTEAVSESRDKG